MTAALQHVESRALYILTTLNIPDTIDKAGHPLSCEEIKATVDEEMGTLIWMAKNNKAKT